MMQPAISAPTAEFLDHLPKLMEYANVPGLAMAVVQDGAVVWTHAVGVKNRATGEAVDNSTVFGAASLSKQVFAYAVLRLVDAGTLDLDRPLATYLPDYAPDAPLAEKITARHVLSHSSGFQNWRFDKDDRLQLHFEPGTAFKYSGEGYFYLQRVLEIVTGQPFEAYMQTAVFAPLGMASSSYVWLPEGATRLAMGHDGRGNVQAAYNARFAEGALKLADEWQLPLDQWRYEDLARAFQAMHPDHPPLPNNLIPNAAGSLLTTASDYARFMCRVLERKTQDELDLRPATRRLMWMPQVRINDALAWGLGWGLEAEAGREYVWQWGDNGNFKAFALGHPATRSGIIILTNSAKGDKLCERIVNVATGHEHSAFLWL